MSHLQLNRPSPSSLPQQQFPLQLVFEVQEEAAEEGNAGAYLLLRLKHINYQLSLDFVSILIKAIAQLRRIELFPPNKQCYNVRLD